MTIALDVYVNDRLVGSLGAAADGAFAFTYLPDVPENLFVSLTMPVRAESYVWSRGLPPFFLMNLPEGYKKDLLRTKLGSQAEVTDLGLLALTGNKTIGRVRVLPHGQDLHNTEDIVLLAEILASKDSRNLLLHALESDILEGVSGVMPKILHDKEKATEFTEQYLLKTGPEDLPGLAINEFLCLEVARKASLPVPKTRLSDDGEVLAVERFDRTHEGQFIAVEDFCVLKGLDPASKYKGSIEDLAKMVSIYVPAAQQATANRQLFKLLLTNYALRNADAHLKNFAFTYTSFQDVALAHVYDIVTVTVYPDYQDDIPGLTLAGRRTWSSGKLLHTFGATRLSLTVSEMNALREEVIIAIHALAPEVKRYADSYPRFREIGKRMLTEWDKGLADILPTASAKAPVPSMLRQASGFSEDRLHRKKPNLYENPDGGFSHKAR